MVLPAGLSNKYRIRFKINNFYDSYTTFIHKPNNEGNIINLQFN